MLEWIDTLQAPDEAFILQQLTDALLGNPPQVPPRYLYDALGSSLFAAITALPEYYPARLEHEILSGQAEEIARSLGSAETLIDLGPGDGAKASALLCALKVSRYVGVDISPEALRLAVGSLSRRFEKLRVIALLTDFSDGLAWPPELDLERPLFFFAGSSIGNFSFDEAVRFLQGLHTICQRSRSGRGDLLIGIDLLKPAELIEAAYDDALGVTACFNRNVLLHLNRVLSADFDLRHFRHRARFNPPQGRIEMSLECTHRHRVSWQGGTRCFSEGEQLVTEHSYKYTPQQADRLLMQSGFVPRRHWFDRSRGYLLCHAESDAR